MVICGNKTDNYSSLYLKDDLLCWKEEHLIYLLFSFVGFFILIVLAYNCTFFCFETRLFITNNIVVNSKCEIIKLTSNLIINVLFIIRYFFSLDDWLIILMLLSISSYIIYNYYVVIPYNDNQLMKTVFALSSICFLCNLILFFKECLFKQSFDGTSILLLIGIILIIVLFSTLNKITFENIENYSTKIYFLNKVRLFIIDFNEKEKKRKYQYTLYKYITNNMQNKKSDTFLLNSFSNNKKEASIIQNHLITSFNNALAKFPTDTSLLIAFASFQCFILNQKQRGYISFTTLYNSRLTLKEEFIVFRNKLLLEHENTIILNDNYFDVSQFMYEHKYSLFIKLIEKSIICYEELWNILMKAHISKDYNVYKLFEILQHISLTRDEVDMNFQSSISINPYDQNLIRLYEKYLYCYQHDSLKIQKYKTKELITDKSQLLTDNIITSNMIKNIKSDSNFDYLIASGEDKSLGQILQISLSICSLCGYSQKNLKGKNIEVLIPDFLKTKHREFMMDKRVSQNYDIQKDYNKCKNVFVLLKTKTQYLLPIDMQITFLYNESNQSIIFTKLIPHLNHDLNTFYILTNKELKIQSFSLASMSYLHLSSNVINSSQEITFYIKELHEKYFTEVTEKPNLNKIKIKRKLIECHYSVFRDITWKNKAKRNDNYIHSTNYYDLKHCEKESEHNSMLQGSPYFKMKVESIRIKSVEGYIFIFEPQLSLISVQSLPNKDTLQIPMSYIPKGIKLSYEPNNKSFLLFSQPEQNIKKYAKEKIKVLLKEQKELLSSNSNYSSSIVHSSLNSDSNLPRDFSSSITASNKDLLQINQMENNVAVYFKVDISKIKLSIYDFKKQMFRDSQLAKCDKIEELMKNDTSISNPNESLEKKIEDNNIIQLTPHLKKFHIPVKEKQLFSQNKSPSIKRFSIFHLIMLASLLVFSVIYFSTVFALTNELENIGLYLNNHFNLEINSVYSSFYATELSLLNNEKYTNYYNTTDDYRAACISYLLSIYSSTNERLNKLLRYESLLSKFVKQPIHSKYVHLKIINSKTEITEYKVNLFSSILEVNTASYRLSLSPTINQTLSNVDYNLISLNGETVNLNALINILSFSFEQLDKIIGQNICIIWVFYCIFIVISLVFSIWNYLEIKIIHTKQIEYLNIYFMISEDTIQKALLESNEFKEIYLEDKFNKISKDKSMNDNEKLNKSYSTISEKDNNTEENKNKTSTFNSIHKDKYYFNILTLVTHFILYILLFSIVTFNTITYIDKSAKIPKIIHLSFHQSTLELTILGMYNNLRNYIIYYTTQSIEANIYETNLKQKLSTAYIFLQTTIDESFTSINNNNILNQKTKTILESIYFQSLCPLFEESIFTFPDQEPLECEFIINNITSSGMNIILVHYIKLMRHLTKLTDNAKYTALSLGFIYNELIYGTDRYKEKKINSQDYLIYQTQNPFFLLSGPISRDLSMLWKYVIRPGFHRIKTALFELFINSIKEMKLFVTVSFSSYYSFLFIYYLFFLFPTIKSITKDLINTKKLVLIIPSKILETCYK